MYFPSCSLENKLFGIHQTSFCLLRHLSFQSCKHLWCMLFPSDAWLEEMQHRLNLCIKTRQNVHPRPIIAFVQKVLSGITQYYRTVGNIWDSLYTKHQLRESSLTLERVYAMLAEFLIELKLHEEQDKIAQTVTGSSSTVKHSMYDEYINASKGKVPAKGKGKQSDGKGTKSRWRPACDDYWKPGGCLQGHNCPKYHPKRQPGRCAICGSTQHSTSQCSRPVHAQSQECRVGRAHLVL